MFFQVADIFWLLAFLQGCNISRARRWMLSKDLTDSVRVSYEAIFVCLWEIRQDKTFPRTDNSSQTKGQNPLAPTYTVYTLF